MVIITRTTVGVKLSTSAHISHTKRNKVNGRNMVNSSLAPNRNSIVPLFFKIISSLK